MAQSSSSSAKKGPTIPEAVKKPASSLNSPRPADVQERTRIRSEVAKKAKSAFWATADTQIDKELL